jgi:hypothetical protein
MWLRASRLPDAEVEGSIIVGTVRITFAGLVLCTTGQNIVPALSEALLIHRSYESIESNN